MPGWPVTWSKTRPDVPGHLSDATKAALLKPHPLSTSPLAKNRATAAHDMLLGDGPSPLLTKTGNPFLGGESCAESSGKGHAGSRASLAAELSLPLTLCVETQKNYVIQGTVSLAEVTRENIWVVKPSEVVTS